MARLFFYGPPGCGKTETARRRYSRHRVVDLADIAVGRKTDINGDHVIVCGYTIDQFRMVLGAQPAQFGFTPRQFVPRQSVSG
ncbi:hypothetical protein [Zavarzinia sp.]|uniref:hypothetical protein n=1 Tax=Zavarzinia sp. TaxID=2027920 RepID=UPI00356712A5